MLTIGNIWLSFNEVGKINYKLEKGFYLFFVAQKITDSAD